MIFEGYLFTQLFWLTFVIFWTCITIVQCFGMIDRFSKDDIYLESRKKTRFLYIASYYMTNFCLGMAIWGMTLELFNIGMLWLILIAFALLFFAIWHITSKLLYKEIELGLKRLNKLNK